MGFTVLQIGLDVLGRRAKSFHDAGPFEAFPSIAAACSLRAPAFLSFAIQGWFDFKAFFCYRFRCIRDMFPCLEARCSLGFLPVIPRSFLRISGSPNVYDGMTCGLRSLFSFGPELPKGSRSGSVAACNEQSDTDTLRSLRESGARNRNEICILLRPPSDRHAGAGSREEQA